MKQLFSALLSAVLLCFLWSLCAVCPSAKAVPEDRLQNPHFLTVLDQYGGSFRDQDGNAENLLSKDGYAYADWRGAAISPDGRYAFAGYLHGGAGAVIYMIDLKDGGKVTDSRIYRDAYGYAQPKGLSTDDRGNLYVGLTFSNNFNLVSFDVQKIDKERTCLEPVTQQPVTVCEAGTPGDTEGTHMGINGVCAVRVGEKYYLYVAVSYRVDRLYRFDVTDPYRPTEDLSFGTNGYLDFQAPGTTAISDRGNTVSLEEAYYIDAAADGSVYLCAKIKGGTLPCGILKISPEGKTESVTEAADAYAIAICGSYAIVTAKNPAQSGVMATVLHLSDGYTQTASFPAPQECGAISYVTVKNDVLYLVDSGTDRTASHLYAAGLTPSAHAGLIALLGCEADTTSEESVGSATADPNTTVPDTATLSPEPGSLAISEHTTECTTDPGNIFQTKPAATAPDTTDAGGGCGSRLSYLPMGMFLFSALFYARTKRKTDRK